MEGGIVGAISDYRKAWEHHEVSLRINKAILHILTTDPESPQGPTAREIADVFLAKPHVPEDVSEAERISDCKKRMGVSLTQKITARQSAEMLMDFLYRAAHRFEPLILFEAEIFNIPGFQACTEDGKADNKLADIKRTIEALQVSLNEPFSEGTRAELEKRRDHLTSVLSQGKIKVTRQRLAALQYYILRMYADGICPPEVALGILNDYVIVSQDKRAAMTYRKALSIIIVELLLRHAGKELHKNQSHTFQLAADIINALIPTLIKQKKIVNQRSIEKAFTGH
jgi:hypothetical protein